MLSEKSVFFCFAALSLISAINVVITRSPVRAALSLIVTFLSTAAIWMLLRAEFLSISLILIYVGAVMVLFLFILMMLDIDKDSTKFAPHPILSLSVTLLVVIGLATILNQSQFGINQVPSPIYPDNINNIKSLGLLLYTRYLFPFLIAGMLLLVAIVATISLTHRTPRKNKALDARLALDAHKSNRLKIIKMDAEHTT